MKARVEAGTDIAMIGAWDASRNDAVVANRWGREWDSILEEDAVRADLFLIRTGADCSAQIDVYWDTEVPPEARAHTHSIAGEFLICVPTGRLMIGGVEDYRSDKPQIMNKESIVHIPGGNYSLRCFVGKEGEEENGSSISHASEMKKALGNDDYRYLQRIEKRGLLGYLILLLYPVLAVPFNWKVALPGTLIPLLAFFGIRERLLKRDARYRRIIETENEVFRRGRQSEAPAFIFELRRVEDAAKLKGGSVRLPLPG